MSRVQIPSAAPPIEVRYPEARMRRYPMVAAIVIGLPCGRSARADEFPIHGVVRGTDGKPAPFAVVHVARWFATFGPSDPLQFSEPAECVRRPDRTLFVRPA